MPKFVDVKNTNYLYKEFDLQKPVELQRNDSFVKSLNMFKLQELDEETIKQIMSNHDFTAKRCNSMRRKSGMAREFDQGLRDRVQQLYDKSKGFILKEKARESERDRVLSKKEKREVIREHELKNDTWVLENRIVKDLVKANDRFDLIKPSEMRVLNNMRNRLLMKYEKQNKQMERDRLAEEETRFNRGQTKYNKMQVTKKFVKK